MTAGSQDDSRQRLVRREQGWDLSISRSGVSFRRFAWVDGDAAFAWRTKTSPAPAGRRLPWLLALVAGCGSLAAGVLAAPPQEQAHGYSVVMPVPDRPVRTARATTHASLLSGRPDRARHRRPFLVMIDSAADAPMGDTNEHSGPADPAEGRFIDAAMRTGSMQSWQAGGARYFLVAGDLQRADNGACRQFSLLVRADIGGDTVRHFERCRATE